ncbi:cytochrome P450 [Pisolithus sp. B1]|nr:cytochrome P450 [Pisolithus sp. B1]
MNVLEELLREYSLQAKAVGALIALAILGKAVRSQFKARRRLPLPPGPPGHWLFGNALPRENQSQQFAEWDQRESVDIMEKEGGLLADRPRAVAGGAAHTHLQAKAAETYGPIQMQAARDVILDILDDPKNHQAHANRYAASVILRITYGKSTPTGTNAPEIVLIHKMLKRFQTLMRPGALLVEKYSILKYVPGYASYLHEWRREERQLFHDQLNRVAQELKTGNPGPSFAKYLLENQETHKLSDEEMAYLTGSLYGAGSDTASYYFTAVALMVLDAVQEELDNVIGRDRAPTFDDYNALPQIQAFMLECLRWRPVTTLGFAHRAQTDIIYKNICIPEGAIVFGNHWAISRDANVYPNPDKFDPQRWLGSDGRIREDLRFPSFGFGRRICPGQHIANRSIFINAALLLWSFRITQDPKAPINDKGFVDGVIAHPKPFAACFTPRIGDEKHLRQVMATYTKDL